METIIAIKQKKFELFKNIDFCLLYFGGLVSWLGSNIYLIALSWYVLDKLGSGMSLATIMLVSSIPEIVLGPLSGVIVDRVNRKTIIVLMDLVRGVIMIIMALYLGHTYFYPVLLMGTFLMAVCGTLFSPAISSSIPNIVKETHLVQANSLMNLSSNFVKITGLALGGLLIALIGVKGIFYLNGLSFIFSAFSEIFIRIPLQQKKVDNEKLKATFFIDLKDGLKFLFSKKSLMTICVLAIILNFFFVGSLGVALPYISKEVLNLEEFQFGFINVFFPVGSIIGAVLLGFISKPKKLFTSLFNGVTYLGILLTLLGTTIFLFTTNVITVDISYWIIGVFLILIGVINVAINVPVVTLFQVLVPDDFRGRFFGFFGSLSQGLIPIAYLVSGIILGIWHSYILLFIGGVAILIVAIGMIYNKELKQL